MNSPTPEALRRAFSCFRPPNRWEKGRERQALSLKKSMVHPNEQNKLDMAWRGRGGLPRSQLLPAAAAAATPSGVGVETNNARAHATRVGPLKNDPSPQARS